VERTKQGYSLIFSGSTGYKAEEKKKNSFMKQENVLDMDHVQVEITEESQDRDIRGQSLEQE
jgi:hypothetical protein